MISNARNDQDRGTFILATHALSNVLHSEGCTTDQRQLLVQNGLIPTLFQICTVNCYTTSLLALDALVRLCESHSHEVKLYYRATDQAQLLRSLLQNTSTDVRKHAERLANTVADSDVEK